MNESALRQGHLLGKRMKIWPECQEKMSGTGKSAKQFAKSAAPADGWRHLNSLPHFSIFSHGDAREGSGESEAKHRGRGEDAHSVHPRRSSQRGLFQGGGGRFGGCRFGASPASHGQGPRPGEHASSPPALPDEQ